MNGVVRSQIPQAIIGDKKKRPATVVTSPFANPNRSLHNQPLSLGLFLWSANAIEVMFDLSKREHHTPFSEGLNSLITLLGKPQLEGVSDLNGETVK
jgi:hypothetical protein